MLYTHKPIELARRTPENEDERKKSIPMAPARHPEWPTKVALRWNRLRGQDAAEDSPHRRLVLRTSAIAQISEEMQKSGMIGEALGPADRIGVTIKCLRAVEGRRNLAKESALKEYPGLKEVLGSSVPGEGPAGRIEALKNHIVTLAKEELRFDLETLKRGDNAPTGSRARPQAVDCE